MSERWIDNQGDIWTPGDDGLMHTPETAPFPREHVERKWGPLRRLTDCQMWHLREIDTGHVLPKPYESEAAAREALGWMDAYNLYRVVQGGCTGDHIN